MVDTHLLFTHNLQRLTDRILVAEETSGKSFGNDALVGSIESRRSIARYQRKVEELKKSRVGQHDDAIFSFGIFHLLALILDSPHLTQYATSLLHIGTQSFDALRRLRP